MAYNQQCVIQLRPEDQIVVIQGGMEKRMLVKSFTDYIEAMAAELTLTMQTWTMGQLSNFVTTTQLNTALTSYVTNSALISALANYVTQTQLTAALALKQNYVAPSAAITNLTSPLATISILGIDITTSAATQTVANKVNSILAVLRTHNIIVP